MDLAKIIAELRVELQYFDTAIASIEELARIQTLRESGVPAGTPGAPEAATPGPELQDPAPVKRRRGRPRKDAPREAGEVPQPMRAGSESSGDSTASPA